MKTNKNAKNIKTESICGKVRKMLLEEKHSVEKIMAECGAAKSTVMVQRHHLYVSGKLKKPSKPAKATKAAKTEAKK